MNQYWINKKQNTKCILFYNGWGMDINAIAHLTFDGLDVCMYNNYRTIGPINENLTTYKTIILVAWSLGVWAAEKAIGQSNIEIHKSIAINGTPFSVHDRYAITDSVFIKTLQEWNETNRVKFNRRMMGGKQNFYNYGRFLSDRSIEDQKEELHAIYSNHRDISHNINWDLALIGMNDLVFPAINQLNWWTGKTKIIETDQPHFPFAGLQNWGQIIER